MSLIRWGSPCSFAGYPWLKWCHEGIESCPGSSVYVYESGGTDEEPLYTCCGCSLGPGTGIEYTGVALKEHFDIHHQVGDHVPLTLFDEATIARADAFVHGMTEDEWYDWRHLIFEVSMDLMVRRQEAWRKTITEAIVTDDQLKKAWTT